MMRPTDSLADAATPPPRHDRPKKLIIQIPCLNEAQSLPATLACLPRQLDGVSTVEWLVVDDGSTDGTAEVARSLGVDHVVVLPRNMGLARAFMAGLEYCLRQHADIIVNFDADNQYCADDIGLLVGPLLSGEADYVVGARPIAEIAHFSPVKKFLQKLGSFTVRKLSRLEIPDAPSGFRAITREAAYKLNVFSNYTYTLETLIQAGNSSIKTVSVPIRVNGETRPSRLVRSKRSYVARSVATMTRYFFVYRAFQILTTLAALLFASGFLIGVRFLFLEFWLGHSGHVQSLLLAVLLMLLGAFSLFAGFLADLIGVNRRLLEQIREIVRRTEHRGAVHDHAQVD